MLSLISFHSIIFSIISPQLLSGVIATIQHRLFDSLNTQSIKSAISEAISEVTNQNLVWPKIFVVNQSLHGIWLSYRA
ncbi:uncharacterized protein LY79DRAFT_363852 [Colletotrichum navitas]|uniref:Uncharacterized protein n=1 Tax=Colletotrichum navitas TaxID=681940 RepID=A0AAD8PQP0_9PEZI|nr:uncharacterized protein LY79DRAFT_363852 [Colletotrichum navitas]KAK1574615.1 hypothetical protein LY79DRAFT_363852 [Colletotrichum navitas]